MRRRRALIGGIVGSAGALLCLMFGSIYQIQQRERNRRQLFHAIQVNDTATVRELLAYGLSADVPLRSDASLGLWDRIKLLLHLGRPSRRAPAISALHQAIRWHSNPEIVRLLLAHGAVADINSVEESWTPLGEALANDNPQIDIVRLLLENGADPNARQPAAGGDAPLLYALSYDRPFSSAQPNSLNPNHDLGPMTKLLLDHGADPTQPERSGRTYLTSEIWAGHCQTVAAMLDHGASINARDHNPQGVPGGPGMTPLGAAIAAGHIPMLKLLLARGAKIEQTDQVGLIGDAVYAQDEAFLKRLLADGISIDSPDERGFTSLMRAASQNSPHQIAEMQMLLVHGANVQAQNITGQTPLITASWRSNSLPALKLLLAHGADPNACDKEGWTALHCAADEAGAGTVSCLLAHGARARLRSRHGYTPLMGAAINNGDPKSIPMLVAAGCDPNARNDRGETALMLARRHHHPAILQALRQAGATQ